MTASRPRTAPSINFIIDVEEKVEELWQVPGLEVLRFSIEQAS